MQPRLRMIALATGAALPSSLRAKLAILTTAAAPDAGTVRARADKLRAKLQPRIDEDVRIVGALAERFAAAAAQRLMTFGLGRRSGSRGQHALRPTLPLIALATGAALCRPVLGQPGSQRPDGWRRKAAAMPARAGGGTGATRANVLPGGMRLS